MYFPRPEKSFHLRLATAPGLRCLDAQKASNKTSPMNCPRPEKSFGPCLAGAVGLRRLIHIILCSLTFPARVPLPKLDSRQELIHIILCSLTFAARVPLSKLGSGQGLLHIIANGWRSGRGSSRSLPFCMRQALRNDDRERPHDFFQRVHELYGHAPSTTGNHTVHFVLR